MAHRRHLPVQNTNDSRLGLVEDKIVDFVVAVHECASIARLSGLVREEAHHVSEMRQLPDWLLGVYIGRLRLCIGDGGKGTDLTVIETRWFAEPFQPD